MCNVVDNKGVDLQYFCMLPEQYSVDQGRYDSHHNAPQVILRTPPVSYVLFPQASFKLNPAIMCKTMGET